MKSKNTSLSISQLKPGTKLLRLSSIIGKNAILPISKSTFYAGIKSGHFPAPLKLGDRISVWREDQILEVVDRLLNSTKSTNSPLPNSTCNSVSTESLTTINKFQK